MNAAQDIFILFGRQLFRDGELDWIAQARCNLAISLMQQYPNTKLIITGGKTTTDRSESSVMKTYIEQEAGTRDIVDRIILEEGGLSTIHQLVEIKRMYLIPNKWFKVGLISDEIHIPRLETIARHICGPDFKITPFKTEVRVSGAYGKAIRDFEKHLFDRTLENPVIKQYPTGDDKAWQLFDEFYREKKVEQNSTKIDINEEALKYLRSVYK